MAVSTGTVFLLVLFAAILAMTVAVVAGNALGDDSGSGTVASQSPAGGATGSTSTTMTTPSGSSSLASGPDQSHAPQFPIVGGEEPGYGNYNAVACASTSTCFAVGADNGGNGVAALSGNGGNTWSNTSLPSGTPPLDSIACADTTHCVAVGQGAAASTSNAGSTWDVSAIPVANTTMVGVTCPSAQTCVAAGVTAEQEGPYGGVVLRSTDGGSSWVQAQLPPDSYGLGDVTCPTPNTCIAVGAQILVSSDGGETSIVATVPGGTQALRSIACSSATTCVAIGSNVDGATNPNVSTDRHHYDRCREHMGKRNAADRLRLPPADQLQWLVAVLRGRPEFDGERASAIFCYK